mmetsp:Transcript_38774/g.94147  ORF Transcript_38774/g.94147 Transcript_38774/m.94147 type:complete len:577 (+) Transcript_38774:190-1920(+)
MPRRRHLSRLTLDVVMENFWTRPAGVYSKPVWLRPDVLQLVYDDDNSATSQYSGDAVPGGFTAFTRTATVYSNSQLTADDLAVESSDPQVELLRRQVPAYTQRVRNCYLVEANLLGFAGVASGLSEEQAVLSLALKWALADHAVRFGKHPYQIVLHLDVNGTLALGDIAGNKNFGKMVHSLAADILKRIDEKAVHVPESTRTVILDTKDKTEEELKKEYTANYSSQDFVRCVMMALGALAPEAVRHLDEEMSGNFAENYRSASTSKAFSAASSADALESPALTIAIRTNGVEHRQGSVYVQRLLHGALGVELSEERDTVRRYIVSHEDKVRGLFFHPVLLEKLHKSNGSYTFREYVADIKERYGIETDTASWDSVSSGTLKKSDRKFKVYLGLCEHEDDKSAVPCTIAPPRLDVKFLRETWLMPSAKHNDYKLKWSMPNAKGPWWAGFAALSEVEVSPTVTDCKPLPVYQPYGIAISSEPVPWSTSSECRGVRLPGQERRDLSLQDTATIEAPAPARAAFEKPTIEMSAKGPSMCQNKSQSAQLPQPGLRSSFVRRISDSVFRGVPRRQKSRGVKI